MNSTIAYGSTLILGALHALEPGHGKSFIAAYLVGEKLSMRHVFTLGMTLLVSHFLLLTAIAMTLRFAFSSNRAEQFHEILSWIGPVLILLFGFYLFFKNRHNHKEEGACHHHSPEIKTDSTLKKTALVGAIGGLLPCPTVIAPVLMSGAVNDFHDSIFYILIYIIGMGVVLLAMISLFYLLKETLVKKLDTISSRINPHLLSAALIIVVGFVYLALRIFSHQGA